MILVFFFFKVFIYLWLHLVSIDFPSGSTVKNPPAMQETWVRFLGQEGHLQKEMAAHCSILAWKIPWAEEPGGLQSIGLQRVGRYRACSGVLVVAQGFSPGTEAQ